ncbi:MAG: hypothetical protein JWO36_2405 [Myxococcales bacterium]|nr:hypothetical protein [Myxococcales bacterium]
MEALAFVLVSGGIFTAVLIRRIWPSHASRTRRVLRSVRVTPIANLAEERLACIVGNVEVEAPLLTAPLSRRPCVAYDTSTWFSTENGVLAQVVNERQLVSFFVVDATGRARVDAPSAALCNRPVVRPRDTVELGIRSAFFARSASFDARARMRPDGRFEERVIEPGMTIRIAGSINLEPGAALDAVHSERLYRDANPVRATITGSSQFPLLVDVIE